ncbi:hypothetical protein [Streptomyces gobitricini]|uniref:Uncharacterized protein n=1 Tax=Streptomyces gobitricini TaxID=68211 RepID=A0ABP6AFV5_9ACTN
MDLAPLADTAKIDKFALVLRIGKGEQATAPAQATRIDPTALAQQLFGGHQPLPSGSA